MRDLIVFGCACVAVGMFFFQAEWARAQEKMPAPQEALVFLHVGKLFLTTFAEEKPTTSMLSREQEKFESICVLSDGRCLAFLSPESPVPTLPLTPQAATSRPSEENQPRKIFEDRQGLKVAVIHPSELVSYQGSPALSPDGGSLVYVGGEQSRILYLLDLNTGKRFVLAEGKSKALAPAWSGDGKKLAYYRAKEGPAGRGLEQLCLRVIRVDTKEDSQVAGPSNIVRWGGETRWPPIWSADGRKVFFEAAYGDLRMSSVYEVSVNPTGPLVCLGRGICSSLAVGGKGLLISDGGVYELSLEAVSSRRLLVEKAFGPKSSLQAKFLAYAKVDGLYVRHLSAGMETTIMKGWNGDVRRYYWTQVPRKKDAK